MKIQITFCLLFLSLLLNTHQLNSAGSYSESFVGCTDKTSVSNCLASLCRDGCIDCSSNTECTSCEYGWFLYHTPENTVECVQCPYYDIDGYNAGTYDKTYIHQCSNCLELPQKWEKIRKCSSSYTFYENTSGNGLEPTPQNTTLNLPELFTIKVDLTSAQTYIATRYYVNQMTTHCDEYTWKNYEIDDLVTDDEITTILSTLNDVVCEECLTGYILKDDNTCEACNVDKCSNCYINPLTQNKECIICESGYSPSADKLSCIICSSLIDLCSDCLFNSISGSTKCTECADNYRPSDDGDSCEEQNCSDANCLSCPDDDDICEECQERYSVDDNYECELEESCVSGTDNCQDCFNFVRINDELVQNYNISCLYCGGNAGDYECLQYCESYYGFSEINNSCVSCTTYMENCKSCIIDADGNFMCISCGNGYGYDDQTEDCRSCDEQYGDGKCDECEYSGGEFYCYNCVEGYGLAFASDHFFCMECIDYCDECYFYTPDDINYIQMCENCISKMYEVSMDETKCEYSCVSLFAQKCVNDQCITNNDYQQYNGDTYIYPSQQSICKVCQDGYSLDSSGETCTKNVYQCQNSLSFTSNQYNDINPFIDTVNVQESNLGYCYNGCKSENTAPGDLFYDPLLQKCVKCVNSSLCRKKVTINRYVYCSPDLATKPSILTDEDEWIDFQFFDSSFLSFDFDFEDAEYSNWNNQGISQFEFNIVFVGSQNKKDQTCAKQIGGFDLIVQSNIPNNIFRIQELSVNFVTWEYSENPLTLGQFGKIYMDIYADYYLFYINHVTKVSLNNLNFYGSKLQNSDLLEMKESGIYQIDVNPFYFYMNDCLPSSQLYLSNISFYHQLNSFIVPIFELEDLGELNIQTFTYSSKYTTSETLTGFKMFSFKKNIWQIQKFKLIVEDFYLSDMMFDQVVFFEIPQKEAYVEMNNINLDTILFKSSQFIGDSSSGLGEGQQWYIIQNLSVTNVQLYDSSLIYITNSRFLKGEAWSFSNIYNILVDNDQNAFINVNTLLIDGISLQDSTFYGTTFIKQNTSPSRVKYYKDYNYLKSLDIQNIKLYLNQNERFISLKANMDIQLSNISIEEVQTTLDTTLYEDLITYIFDQETQVYAYSRYKVKAITDTNVPKWLIEVGNEIMQNKLTIDGFSAYGIDDISILYLSNLYDIEITTFECGSKHSEERLTGICIQTYIFGTTHGGQFQMSDSLIKNMQSDLNPLYIEGYNQISIDGYKVYDLKVKQGVHLDPWGENSVISITNSQFEYVKTFLKEDEQILGAGIYVDQSNASSLTLTISDCTFTAIKAKDIAAGIHIYSPSHTLIATLDNIVFNNVIALKGGVIYADLSSTDKSYLNLNSIEINGPGQADNFEFVQTIGIEDGEVADVMNLSGYDYYFSEIVNYGNSEDKFTDADIENLYFDSFLEASVEQPSSIYITNGYVEINDLQISKIYLQQGFYIEKSILNAENLVTDEVICIQCSEYNGSNILVQTDFSIINSYFKNSQSYYGGGLYVKNSGVCSEHDNNCKFTTVYFQNNWAYAEGGGLYITDSLFYIKDSFFINNTAQGDYRDEDNPVRGQGGGIFSSCTSAIGSVENDRRVLASYKNYLKNTNFGSNVAQFGAAGKITGGTSLEQSGNVYLSNEASLYNNDLQTSCVYGEGQQTGGICYECPENQYSLDENGTSCTACMEHATCLGQDRIILDAGYWRAHNYTDNIEHCKNKEENCLKVDSVSNNNFTCEVGYVGALCQACDLDGKTTGGVRYSASSNYTCGKCDDQAWNGIKVFLVNLWVIISMFLAVKGTLTLVQEKIMLRSILTLFRGFRAKYNETGILIKMFMNYTQIIFILSTLDISLPTFLLSSQDSIGNPVKSMGNALDCYLVHFQNSIPNIYFKIIWQLVTNTIQFIVFFGLYQLYKKVSKKNIKNIYLLWTTLIYQLLYLQPSYVNIILETISCVEFGGYSWILADVQYLCHTDEYNKWTYFLLVPFLCFWVLILPCIMFYVLFKHKKEGTLQDSKNLYKFGFLYQEYKQEAFYWELVKVVQKTLIVAVIQLYSNEIKEKAILVFEIVFIYGIIVYFKHPYQSKQLNNLDILIVIVCCLSLITGVFIYQNPYTGWEIWGLILIFVTNLWLILYIIYLIFKKSIDDLNQKHAEKIEKLKSKIPFLRKLFKQSPDSIKKRKQAWKRIREQVKLFIDGKQAGIVYSVIPSPYDIEEEKEEKESVPLFHQQSQEKMQYIVKQVTENTKSELRNERKKSSLIQDMDQFVPNFVRNSTSTKSFIVPDAENYHAQAFKDNIKSKKYSSIDILLNKVQGEALEQVLQVIKDFREARRKDLLETKNKYRQYFIDIWKIQPGKQENEVKEIVKDMKSSKQSSQMNNSKLKKKKSSDSIITLSEKLDSPDFTPKSLKKGKNSKKTFKLDVNDINNFSDHANSSSKLQPEGYESQKKLKTQVKNIRQKQNRSQQKESVQNSLLDSQRNPQEEQIQVNKLQTNNNNINEILSVSSNSSIVDLQQRKNSKSQILPKKSKFNFTNQPSTQQQNNDNDIQEVVQNLSGNGSEEFVNLNLDSNSPKNKNQHIENQDYNEVSFDDKQ